MTLTFPTTIEVATPSALPTKTQRQLRERLEQALEETVADVLAQFDIDNQLSPAVRVDEAEVDEEEQS